MDRRQQLFAAPLVVSYCVDDSADGHAGLISRLCQVFEESEGAVQLLLS